jgi:hypothetical protein
MAHVAVHEQVVANTGTHAPNISAVVLCAIQYSHAPGCSPDSGKHRSRVVRPAFRVLVQAVPDLTAGPRSQYLSSDSMLRSLPEHAHCVQIVGQFFY